VTYTIVIERGEDGGWGGTIPDLPGLLLMGDTREELLANAPDAIRAHIAASRELGLAVHELGENLAQVEVSV